MILVPNHQQRLSGNNKKGLAFANPFLLALNKVKILIELV